MPLTLYSHPFSSYCQKVLIAFWENDVSFEYRHLEEPGARGLRGGSRIHLAASMPGRCASNSAWPSISSSRQTQTRCPAQRFT